MKTQVVKVGVMPREKYQARLLAIASGEYKLKKGEPKIWFNSMKSLSEVLSDNNRLLLSLIKQNKPETLKELAELSGRAPSNLSRTLHTLEHYGIVDLEKHNKSVRPI